VPESQSQESQMMAAVVMFRGNQSLEHREIRLLRVETMFGAAHHNDLKEIIRGVFNDILLKDQELLGVKNDKTLLDAILPVLVFSRFAFFGQAVLEEFGFVQPTHSYLLSYVTQVNQRILSVASEVPK
jgi:hypothetical protein